MPLLAVTLLNARRIDLYRAFDKDAEDNRAALQKDGRLKMPVLGMDGPQVSTWASLKRDA